ncbi:MAG: hypothetical protein FJX73_10740 [Armatimonadetes bacterium]|nr:hypothetical protein [Armatimonadota bacterium]
MTSLKRQKRLPPSKKPAGRVRLSPTVKCFVGRLRGYEVEWRLRVGDWRVRFSVSGGQIVILRVLPRSAAYR